jgi:prepilin signal peptidase PulO-like enzyme (type II secretory pathway)
MSLPLIFLIFPFLLGLIVGSFLNCFIWRLYKNQTVLGRSYCPICEKKIKWYDNIPLLSFVFLKRKCRFCKNKIAWQYPLVEISTAILFALSFALNMDVVFSDLSILFSLVLISLLTIIFVFDWRWFLIPVQVLVFGAIVFLGFNLIMGFSFWQILLTTAIGAGFFALQYIITRGRGIGEGDIWLGGFLGVAFPVLSHLVLLLFLTYIIGGLVSIILLISGLKKIGGKIPLGIFLSIAAVITLFWAEGIISWYMGLM